MLLNAINTWQMRKTGISDKAFVSVESIDVVSYKIYRHLLSGESLLLACDCVRVTRLPKATEKDAFGPSSLLQQSVKVRFFDDQFEGFETLMSRLILLQPDDVDSSRNQIRFYRVSGNRQCDSSNVTLHREVGAGPRHDAAAGAFSNDDIAISLKVRFYSVFR